MIIVGIGKGVFRRRFEEEMRETVGPRWDRIGSFKGLGGSIMIDEYPSCPMGPDIKILSLTR